MMYMNFHYIYVLQLSDLSSLSSASETEGVESHRRFSSTSYILKKKGKNSDSKEQTQATAPPLSTQVENMSEGEDMSQLSHANFSGVRSADEAQNTLSSLEFGGHGMSLLDCHGDNHQAEDNQTGFTTLVPAQSKESNRSNGAGKLNGHCGLAAMSHSESTERIRHPRSVQAGTKAEKPKSLEEQVDDMQVDIEQLLQYTQVSRHITCRWSLMIVSWNM